MDKVFRRVEDAISDIPDGATIMFGGWGRIGYPGELTGAIGDKGVSEIVAIANDAGNVKEGLEYGISALVRMGRVKKFIGSYHAWNKEFERQYENGQIEFEVVPQGTLAERIRAAGAGIGSFYVTTGVDTELAEGKEIREIKGIKYVLEEPLAADFAVIAADTADEWGNCICRYTAKNFNPVMATAATVVIVEVRRIVPVGQLDPNHITIPGLYVDRIVERSRS